MVIAHLFFDLLCSCSISRSFSMSCSLSASISASKATLLVRSLSHLEHPAADELAGEEGIVLGLKMRESRRDTRIESPAQTTSCPPTLTSHTQVGCARAYLGGVSGRALITIGEACTGVDAPCDWGDEICCRNVGVEVRPLGVRFGFSPPLPRRAARAAMGLGQVVEYCGRLTCDREVYRIRTGAGYAWCETHSSGTRDSAHNNLVVSVGGRMQCLRGGAFVGSDEYL